MRLSRPRTRVSSRRQLSAGGCLSAMLMLGIMGGVGVLAWDWLMPYFSVRPATADELRAQMQGAFEHGDLDEVIRASQALATRQADDWQAHAQLIRALIYRSYTDYAYEKDRSEALRMSQQQADAYPEDKRWQALLAYALQHNGRALEASRLALQVIADNPDSVPARLALSGAYGGQGIFEAALRDASKAVELANRGIAYNDGIDWRVDALRAVAIAFSDLGRYDEARRAIERAIDTNRRLIPLHFEAALFAQQVGDADSATANYFNIIAFDPQNAKARLRLCDVSSRLGERDAAVTYCQEATTYAPAWSETWYRLGREHYLRGDFPEAVKALNRCTTLQIVQEVPISERQLDCWYIQGQSAEVLGDCRALMAVYTQFQAMRREGDLPQVWTYPPEGPSICLQLTTTPS